MKISKEKPKNYGKLIFFQKLKTKKNCANQPQKINIVYGIYFNTNYIFLGNY